MNPYEYSIDRLIDIFKEQARKNEKLDSFNLSEALWSICNEIENIKDRLDEKQDKA